MASIQVPRWSPSPRKSDARDADDSFPSEKATADHPAAGDLSQFYSSDDESSHFGSTKGLHLGLNLENPKWKLPQSNRLNESSASDTVNSPRVEPGSAKKVHKTDQFLSTGSIQHGEGEHFYPLALGTDETILPILEDRRHVRQRFSTPPSESRSRDLSESAVWVTWKDLWVTVTSSKGGTRPLLQGLTGYAEPGGVMAIMGPSGSGKSTLLDTLAGRLSANTKQTGEILVNGRRQSLSYGNSAYVTQDDVLLATLTVMEAVFYSAQLQLPNGMPLHEKRERAESTIREMGLQDCINTQIGGWRSRGLSGGEKRRVSIAIESLTRPRLLFLDEPTSGLDSAAAFHVVKRLKHLAMDGKTVIASIHQPSSDVFELFTDLYLLSNGRTVYFGEASGAREFFADNGFQCPPLRNPSDHYLRTINSDFERDVEDIEASAPTSQLTTEEVIKLLVDAYKSSKAAMQVSRRINEMSTKQGAALESFSDHANFLTQVHVLTRRSFKNMYRDLGYYWLRLAIYVALCLCVGTIFYKVGYKNSAIQARAAMLMFVGAFLTFMAIGGFPAFVEDMRVFDRDRLNGHYGVASFVFANTFSSIPFLLLISALPGAIAYFLVDLHHGFVHFAYFTITLFACMIVVESLMMTVASIVPDFLMGIITGAGIQGVFMLNGGFFRLPNDLPKPFWKYPMSYIAFHTYANQGFYKNDFEGLSFENNVMGGPRISGETVLRDNFQVTMSYSKWVDLLIILGMAILYRIIFFVIIKLKEKLRPMIRTFLSRRAASQIMFTIPPQATTT